VLLKKVSKVESPGSATASTASTSSCARREFVHIGNGVVVVSLCHRRNQLEAAEEQEGVILIIGRRRLNDHCDTLRCVFKALCSYLLAN
jgi:hypothetical protein